MKKPPLFIAATIVLFLIGCSKANHSNADFQGVILAVGDQSIIVGEEDVNPEASYESYEVLIDDSTVFNGDISSMKQLKDEFVEDKKFDVCLRVKEKFENNHINNKVVTKLRIDK